MISENARSSILKALQLCEGSFYLYDLDILDSRLNQIRSNLDSNIKLYYACKANPLSSILKLIQKYNFGLDVASSGELFQAGIVEFDFQKVLATGPAKSKQYLKTLVDNNISTVVIESKNQLLWLNEIARLENKKIDVLLRLQINWADGTSVLGGNKITPFGQDAEEWMSIDLSDLKHLNVLGFHLFQWGNILSLTELESIWETTLKAMTCLAKDMNINLQVCDLGGGLGVPYNTDKLALNFNQVHNVLLKLKEKYKIPQIYMELGRYLVADCGYYVSKIIDQKIVRGQDIVVTEGGSNHIARTALTGEQFPCDALGTYANGETKFQVHGPLCTALDNLGTYNLPTELKIGDYLVFSQTGAYGFTESMPYFLAHPQAAEVVSYQGKISVIRKNDATYSWMV